MKRYTLIIVIFLVASISFAESVWTGNAAVGSIIDFPGESETYRASSNSFPPGTLLKVTNPRGGRSVEVVVVGRLESPGVFILLESRAGTDIGLPADHVVPVRVTPFEIGDDSVRTDGVEEESPFSPDSDFNPAASISESDETARFAERDESSVPADETLYVVEEEPESVPVEIQPENEVILVYEFPDD